MREYYMLNRETIKIGDLEFTLTTHSVDLTAWHLAYSKGWRKPSYPVPAIREGFEFGLLLGGGVRLLHWKQGVYDAAGTD